MKEQKTPLIKQKETEALVRIASQDIPASKKVYAGLTRIKGVSWAVSNAICNILKIEKTKKVSELSESEIKSIEKFLENPKMPNFLLNRNKDLSTGENKHLITTKLDLQKEFDIKRMKKIKCWKGVRHILGQPVRGQKTRSHFRSNRSVGVRRVKQAPAKAK